MMTSAAFAFRLKEERRQENQNKTVLLTHRWRVTVSPPAGSRDDDDILMETLRGLSSIPVTTLFFSSFFFGGIGVADFCCSQLRKGALGEGGKQ